MASDSEFAADAALFRSLRRTWEQVDPVPADFVDRMVAAVAASDLSREYELLTLVADLQSAAVRGEAETLTLQFTDGKTNVLVHVTVVESGARRLDGWVDAAARTVRLIQDDAEFSVVPGERGRFAFDEVPSGVSRLQVTLAADERPDVMTPRFEV